MKDNQIISKAVIFIETNLYEPLTVESVANAVSYSYYHFHRYFQAVTGETIGSYIRSRRLTQAAYDLIYGNRKILDIAVSLYFESAESFTRAFKKRYGITPTEYRKNGVDVLIGKHRPMQLDKITECNYENLSPEIVTFEPKSVVGFKFNMSIEKNNSIEMWEKLNAQLAKQDYISMNKNRYSIYETGGTCLSNTFDKNSEAAVFIGIETSGGSNIPEGMELKEISGGRYAKFIHKGTVKNLLSTYYYIWGVWLPKSSLQLDDRDDLECYTEQFLGAENEESQIEIYFPIE
ncbi:AraC family transcriptional regulator [Clostridium sp. HV4-5-A1G]|uniref:AraC family transcriptional regulator n=1 Tax=Clostridium sp. HV4-5-A1G TaxID=2004595 RepID=UPI00123AC0B7|nr:GyrI-like domain-containing protein [Clostridium sp. HV4-5-A1G]KAA8674521.1 AraC family transcriptional regulator [Clostridium sp. HV4-5-A1G]